MTEPDRPDRPHRRAARPRRLHPERRRRYQELAGLTDGQLEQTVGEFTVDRTAARARGFTDEDVDSVLISIREMTEQVVIISAYYNRVALTTDQDARRRVSTEDQAADRALLDQYFTNDYQLTGPIGNISSRGMAMAAMMSGMIRKEGFGSDGFATRDQRFVLHGESALTIAAFDMNATQLARNIQTGEIRRRPRVGTFRQTNTYVRQDGTWLLAATHLSQLPPEAPAPDHADWVYIHDKEPS